MIPTKEMEKLRAFHGDAGLKKQLVAEVLKHQKADQIARRTYGEVADGKWRGCAVGCSIRSLNIRLGKNIPTNQHSAYPEELGIPEALARLEDYLFEAMPADKAMKFPAEFLKAIPVGADLSKVPAKFIVATLKDVVKLNGVKGNKQVVKAVLEVAQLWEKVITGEKVESAAWSAAESAVESAAYSAARNAAYSAARNAARSVARSAAWSAVESAAESAAAYKMSRTLIKLLKNAAGTAAEQ